MRATWYVLEDGAVVDPSECSADEKGNVLTHVSGVAVAMRVPGVPMSRGVDLPADYQSPVTVVSKPDDPAPARRRRSSYKTR